MALDFEAMSAADRDRRREKQRLAVAGVAKTSSVAAAFLTAEASQLLEIQFRMEDALLAVASYPPPLPSDRWDDNDDNSGRCEAAAGHLRTAIPLCQEMGAQLVLAAQTSIGFVSKALGLAQEKELCPTLIN